MKIRVIKIFGHEVARLETHEEATVSDVVAAMIAHRMEHEDEDEEGEVCACCGELLEEEDEDEEISSRFADMTERIVWDARADDDEPPPEFFQ